MTKNPSKTTLRNMADLRVSAFMRSIGRCEWCGDVRNLQTAHGISRSWGSLRYDPRNLLCLCASCHRKVDQNFTLKWEVWTAVKGKEAVEWLKLQRPQPGILTKEFYQKIIEQYPS
jgi:hypothetical protein